MKRATFFKYKQFEIVAHQAPTIFMYWGDCAMADGDFIDYGAGYNHYFLKESVMRAILSKPDCGELSNHRLMEALKLGAIFGEFDIEEKFHKRKEEH